jgi:hypothetical protein
LNGDASDCGLLPGLHATLALTATGWGLDRGIHDRLMSAVAADSDGTSRRMAVARRAVTEAGGGVRVEVVGSESLKFQVYLPQAGGAAAPDDETPVPLHSL